MSTTKASTRSGEPGGSGEPTEASLTLVDLLVPVSFEIVAIVTRVGAEHDVSLTLMRMLGILRDRTLTMARLADFLGLERSTVSGLADRAERRGLVERQTSTADGRSTELRLTRKGQEQAQIAATEVAARVAPIVHDLPEELRRSLPGLLEALRLGKPGLG